jgi:CRP/FNR family transcriptional regulator
MAELTAREIATVRQAAMFASLSDEAICDLMRDCRRVRLGPSQPICRPDELATCFFLILAGHVRIFKLAPSGEQQVLHIYGPGQTFAEAAAMKRMLYPAHAEAMDSVTLIAIEKATFEAALLRNTEMVTGLVAGLSAKLKELTTLAEQLSLRKAPSRLAIVLLEEMGAAGGKTFRLSRSKKQIAEQIGTTPETLSRTLRKFHEERLIDMHGAEITILDEESITHLAGGGG